MKKSLQNILFYPLYCLYFLLSLLPLRILYIFSDGIYYIVYYIVRYRRTVVRRNLILSFPGKGKKEILCIERKFYSNLCDYFFDAIKLTTISAKEISRRMHFEGFEEIKELAKAGKSSVVYLSHTFNWEWISSLPLGMGNDKTIIFGQVYHKLSNKAFDRLFLKIRGRFGTISIPMADIYRKIVGYRKEQRPFIMGLIADQAPRWDHIEYWIDFFHQDTPVINGTEKIIKKTNSAAFFGSVSSTKRGYYVCKFELMHKDTANIPDYQLTDLYFKKLEADIQKTPESWLWTHKRWKHSKESILRHREEYQSWKLKMAEKVKDSK